MSSGRDLETTDLDGKVSLVTGAASGIGRATALLLGSRGSRVLCADLDEAGARGTADEIRREGGVGEGWRLDVTRPEDWDEMSRRILQEAGRLDISVHSAGVSHACPLADVTLEAWRRVMAVNLEGAMLGTQHAVRLMRQGGRGGAIVNVASVSGIQAQAGASAYCVSKAGLIMLSKVAALECLQAGDRIRVNSISPGGVRTPIWKSMPFFRELMEKEGGEEQAFAAMEREGGGGRFAEPEEVASAIYHLVSGQSGHATGTNLVMDQGATA